MRVLIAEDERDLNRLIKLKLTSQGYSVDAFTDGREAMAALALVEYDCLVLDIMMPHADGYEVLRSLRDAGKTTPVLFLTARDSVADRVRGLDAGANDYLVKPFSFEELLARIRALLRVTRDAPDNTVRVGGVCMDTATRAVSVEGRPVSLSPKEYALLEYLMRNAGKVVTRAQIEQNIWNFDYEGGTNVVDVYIRYLRKKIDVVPGHKLIHTVRGYGYMMRDEQTATAS